MAVSSQTKLNAAHVADAVYTSMRLRHALHAASTNDAHDLQTLQTLMESIDTGLKIAGLSFADYLERVRHVREINATEAGQRWRFSARERAAQQVDDAMAHLCALVQASDKCAQS